jgi:mannose-6-phosphate isomerase-like protein (cupin superfamily)
MDKLITAAFVVMLAAILGAQTPPVQKPGTQPPVTQTPPKTPPKPIVPPPGQAPAQAPPQTTKPPAPRPATSQTAARATAMLFVSNPGGQPLSDVKVTLSGAGDREGVTTREGSLRLTNLRGGTYRARFDASDYILFEKELVLRQGQVLEAEVTLNPAPIKKVEAPPPPPPVRKPVEAPAEPPGEVAMLSLSDWLDRNLIGRSEPQRESPVGLTAGAAAAVFQIRENVTERVHPDADEMLYVIAGEATVRIGDRAQALAPGWFVSVPRGTTFAIERRGRNPLIVLTILAPGRGALPSPR